MKLAIIGTGYVGLVTGTCFADCGNDVTCIDKDVGKIEGLKQGKIPIFEPGLEELVVRNAKDGRLTFTTDLAAGIAHADLIFIAVGTPQADDGSADLSGVWAVTDALAAAITGPKIVVMKSTVPVGTNQQLFDRLKAKCKHPVDTASNPEFLKEGAAIEDCTKPDRVVVGVRTEKTAEVLRQLYAPFLRTERPFVTMSPESAEMTKYVANAMLATKISFINEMANLCERMGADINDVRKGIGHDVRIGFQFLHPGAGYGGSCFTADETIFVERAGSMVAERIENLFLAGEAIGRGENVEVRALEGARVLAYDLDTGRPTLAGLRVLTRRPYAGTMTTLRTSMGRSVCLTEDHPMIRRTPTGGHEIVLARDIAPGNQLPSLRGIPRSASALSQEPMQVDTVRVIDRTSANQSVYSLETTTGTVVVGSGLVVHNCFPKDVRAIMSMASDLKSPLTLMQSVDEVNEAQKTVLIQKVQEHFGDRLRGKTLAVWGLAFKPRTDDIREAPALVLIDFLLKAGVAVRVHDPEAMPNVRAIYGDKLVYCDRPYGALEDADGLAIVTEWAEFRNPDFEVMKRLLTEKVIFDGRNVYEPRIMADLGFTYYSIGRRTVGGK